MLEGAKTMDSTTKKPDLKTNPAALLALSWYFAGNGKGEKDMVILPYKDSLLLFSRYLPATGDGISRGKKKISMVKQFIRALPSMGTKVPQINTPMSNS